MRIFNSGKIKSRKNKKGALRQWLEKLISPAASDKIKSARPKKIKSHICNMETSKAMPKQEKSKRHGLRKAKAAISPCETLPVETK